MRARAPGRSPGAPLPYRTSSRHGGTREAHRRSARWPASRSSSRSSLAACDSGSSPPSPTTRAVTAGPTASPAAGSSAEPSSAPVKLTVGLGYIPNVQFAQFYLAEQAGYYRDAGLDVTFQNGRDAGPHPARGAGPGRRRDRRRDERHPGGQPRHPGPLPGDDLRQVPQRRVRQGVERDQDRRRPQGPQDRHARQLRLGLDHAPGAARLGRADHRPTPRSRYYPDYGQLVGVEQGQVDAATGFANNEPLQLARTGSPPVVLTGRLDRARFPGNGLIAGTKTLATKRDAIALFIGATLRAMDEISADPEKGIDRRDQGRPRARHGPRRPSGRSSTRRSTCGTAR